jgi:hypothetical protein
MAHAAKHDASVVDNHQLQDRGSRQGSRILELDAKQHNAHRKG